MIFYRSDGGIHAKRGIIMRMSYFSALLVLFFSTLGLSNVFFSSVAFAQSGTSTDSAKSFSDKFKINGMFRFRYQAAKKENQDTRPLQRIYVNLGTQVAIEENLNFNFRLLSYTSANGGNQTLGEDSAPGFPRRYIGIDHAYLDYKPVSEASVFLGKMPQFFFNPGKNPLILDQDIAPEGVGTKLKYKITDGGLEVFSNLGSFLVKEKYDTATADDSIDSVMNVIDLGVKVPMEAWTLNIGAGVYNFTSIQGDAVTVAGATSAKGNTLTSGSRYANEYRVNHYGLELQYKAEDWNAMLFADVIENQGASNENKGSIFGVNVGCGKFTAIVQNFRLEKDATLAAFTDSDIADGETNHRGNSAALRYKLSNNVQAGLTVYKVQQNVATTSTTYDRTHVDLIATF